MQKILSIVLFAMMFAGFSISPALAQSDQRFDDFEQKRQGVQQHYDEKYRELDAKYTQYKEELFKKIEKNDFSDEEIDSMYEELLSFYEDEYYAIDSEMMRSFEELDKTFQKELDRLEKNSAHSDKNIDSREAQEREHFESDPEWSEIQPLAQRITDIIPLEKMQKLWMSPQHEQLVKIIVSETDLTRAQANKVITFFERVEQDNTERQIKDNQIQSLHADFIIMSQEDSKINRLEQTITKLQEENDLLQNKIVRLQTENDNLQDTIIEFEEKVEQLNSIVREQIKIIYEWVLGQ